LLKSLKSIFAIFAWNSAQYVEAERNKYFKRKKGRNYIFRTSLFCESLHRLRRNCHDETDFKTRHRNHTASFRQAKRKNSAELSKHIWTLKNDNIDYSISWRVLSSSSPYNSSSKRCNLCLKEKFLIICRPDLSSLNKRYELVSSSRHRNKALLRNS